MEQTCSGAAAAVLGIFWLLYALAVWQKKAPRDPDWPRGAWSSLGGGCLLALGMLQLGTPQPWLMRVLLVLAVAVPAGEGLLYCLRRP